MSFAEAIGREPEPRALILPGAVMELDDGLIYQVFSIDATGRVILDLLDEIEPDGEDDFLSGQLM
jgi:hypothetical protein